MTKSILKCDKNLMLWTEKWGCRYIPVLSARSFIETTSEPDPASLIAKAPICSPLRSWEENILS